MRPTKLQDKLFLKRKAQKWRRRRPQPSPTTSSTSKLSILLTLWPWLWHFWGKFWRLIGVMVVILALIGAYFDFSPDIWFSSRSPMDPRNAFSAPFTIQNQGDSISVQIISMSCYLYEAQASRGGRAIGNRFSVTEIENVHIKPHGTQTVWFHFSDFLLLLPDENILPSKLDVSITLKYWKFIKRTYTHSFTCLVNSEGKLDWYPSN